MDIINSIIFVFAFGISLFVNLIFFIILRLIKSDQF